MNERIKIVPSDQKHYADILRIYNESFLPKFGFITRNKEKQKSFMEDFGVIDLETSDKEFVAVQDGEVLGILSLRYRGQSKNKPQPKLSGRALIRKYGLTGIIKAIIFDRRLSFIPPEGELYIDSISVSKDARGMGVGTCLMKYADNLAMDKGFDRVSLKVMFENPRAKDLYEQCGYSVVSEESFSWFEKYSGYSGAYYMVKYLGSSER